MKIEKYIEMNNTITIDLTLGDLTGILSEADAGSAESVGQVNRLISQAIQVLMSVGDKWIDTMSPEIREVICKHLKEQCRRYEKKAGE